MTNLTQSKEVAKLQAVVGLSITVASLSEKVTDPARDILDTMFSEAAEHGFTESDVVRAVLRPVFQRRKGCDCYTCKTRREETMVSQAKSLHRVQVTAG